MNVKNILNVNAITISLAALSIIIPIIWAKYDTKANISVYRKSSTEIARDNIGAGEKLEISYNGSSISQLNISLFVLENTGNKPIKSEDVKSPVRIHYSGDVKILEAQIIDQHPKNLGAAIKVTGNDVLIEQDLLNKSDSIAFKIISSGNIKSIESTARIADIGYIDYKDQASLLSNKDQNASLKDYLLMALLLFSTAAFFNLINEARKIRSATKNTLKSQFIYELSPEKIEEKVSEFLSCGLLEDELKNFKQQAETLMKKEKSSINEDDKIVLQKSLPTLSMSFIVSIIMLMLSIATVYSIKDVLLFQAVQLLGL